MANFLDKLKKGMGAEPSFETEEEIVEKPVEDRTEEAEEPLEMEEKKEVVKKIPTIKMKRLELKKIEPEKTDLAQEEFTSKKIPVTDSIPEKEIPPAVEEKKNGWGFNHDAVGQLAIDVYQTANDLVIQSAIAGIKPDTLDISIEKDIVTIKGSREKPSPENGDYFSQECYWGSFFREVILPDEVDPNLVAAQMKNGILTIRIPRLLREKKRKISVKNA